MDTPSNEIEIHPDIFPEQTLEELIKTGEVISYPLILGSTIRGGKMYYGSGAKCLRFEESEGLWMGNASFASAVFSVNINTGKLKCSNVELTDSVKITGLQAGSEIAIQGWTHDMTFSATDHDTVAWTSGTIKLLDGTTFAIDAGNTATMSAISYIYFSKNDSETVLQISTTCSDAIGANKILVCTAQNVAVGKKAIFQPFSGNALGGASKLMVTDNLAANCVTANLVGTNEIIAHTANIKDAVISNAKITGTILVGHTEADVTADNTASGISGQGALATLDTADFDTKVSGATKPANNATVGATWGTNLNSIPGTLGTPAGTGLFLSATHLGYFDNPNWKTYMDSDGNFYLGGTSGSLQWTEATDTLKIKTTTANAIEVAYGSDILLSHGGDIKFTSVTVPTALTNTLITTGTGNVDNGYHEYMVTFVNEAGETNGGGIGAGVTVDATHKQVALSAIPTSTSGSVTARRIYRTKAGDATVRYLLTTINDNTTTIYTDNTADTSLGVKSPANSSFGKVWIDGNVVLRIGSSNVGVGMSSGPSISSGEWNTTMGRTSGNSITTGSYNSMFGGFTGFGGPTTGSNNSYFGYGAGGTYIAIEGVVAIGYYAGHYDTASDSLYIDNRDRTNITNQRTQALIYGKFNAATANQKLTINGLLRLSETKTPANASDTGATGDIAWDASYIYVCTATNTWKRSAIVSW